MIVQKDTHTHIENHKDKNRNCYQIIKVAEFAKIIKTRCGQPTIK